MKHLKHFFILSLFCIYHPSLYGQVFSGEDKIRPPFLGQDPAWVDSVMNTMTLDEMIGQLIMVAGYSNRDQAFENSVTDLIQEYNLGGVIFFQGNPKDQVRLVNKYQSEAEIPLLIGIDGEWGLGMRLDSTMSFPYQMALGAIQDDSLIYEMGTIIAAHMKRVGVHINFAPVVDVNNNPDNPVINFRSFGEQKENVARKSIMYMNGMQDQHVMACAKHFPGHGDTGTDSHYALPVITHDRDRLDSLELYPFRRLIHEGVGSIMVGHLNIPSLDPTENQASSLSKPIVTGLLREELGYEGLITTDAMNMKAVADNYPPGVAGVKTLLAGNDMILMPVDVAKTINEIKSAIKRGELTKSRIEGSVRKVLAAKAWTGAKDFQPIDTTNIIDDLNSPEANLISRKLTKASITLLQNKNNLLPFQRLDTIKAATIAIGLDSLGQFQQVVNNYITADHYFLPEKSTEAMVEVLRENLDNYNLLIVSIHRKEKRPNLTMALSPEVTSFIEYLSENDKAVFTFFRNPYLLNKYPSLENSGALLVTYQDDRDAQRLAAQVLFGGVGAKGRLPVTVNENFRAGDGLDSPKGLRLQYSQPEAVGMDRIILSQIDTLVTEAIKEKAIPGAVVLVAKDGKIIYNKAFGHHTYDSLQQVKTDDLYDLASLTKVSASLPALMKLHSEGKINLDDPISKYIKVFRRKGKRDITFREALTHQAGLKAWIPFWKNTVKKNGKFKWFTFKTDSSKRFPYKVADNLYLNRNYYKKIFKAIRKSPVDKEQGYVYSDLSFYTYPILVQELTGQSFISYLNENFYSPLGANTLTFNPFLEFGKDEIVPTEYDSLFRKNLIHGKVHDEGAAMLNGISGHAGLFGNANDLAKLMQMYLEYGHYGGRQYIDSATIAEFTRCQFCDGETKSRRAIGFDRPNDPYIENGNTARDASLKSYGHTGFTGTMAWVDPEHNLIYIFFSNRVYPTRENTKLYKLNTRTDIQQVLYDAIKGGKEGL